MDRAYQDRNVASSQAGGRASEGYSATSRLKNCCSSKQKQVHDVILYVLTSSFARRLSFHLVVGARSCALLGRLPRLERLLIVFPLKPKPVTRHVTCWLQVGSKQSRCMSRGLTITPPDSPCHGRNRCRDCSGSVYTCTFQ